MTDENIKCDSCGSSFNRMFLIGKQGNADVRPLCGASMKVEEETQPDLKTFYYYKYSGGAHGTLTDTLLEGRELAYTFEALDIDDAERQLKEVCPDSPLFKKNSIPQMKCPRCLSTEIQLVPRKYSLLTGFATNRFDRVCVRCKKRF